MTSENKYPDEIVREACQVLLSDHDPHHQRVCDAVLSLRNVFSRDTTVVADAPALLVRIIKTSCKDSMSVIEDAVCVLANITSGTTSDIDAVVKVGGLDALVHCASKPHVYSLEVLRQVIWGMGNICGDSTSTRDMFNATALPVILPLAANKELMGYRDFCQKYMRCLSTCVRGDPSPDLGVCVHVLPIVVNVLEDYFGNGTSVDKVQGIDNVVADALTALSSICDGSSDGINLVLKTGIVPQVMSLLEGRPRLIDNVSLGSNPTRIERAHDYVQRKALLVNGDCICGVLQYVPPGAKFNDVTFLCKDWFYDVVCDDPNLFFRARHPNLQHATVALPALCIVGNIVTGDDEQTYAITKMPRSMTFLHSLLQHPNAHIRKDAAWTLSNIAAGTHE
eukprot:PhM_4_TR2413/c3_g1_i3/m.74340/K15043/KPNA2; importin subunit alpha-2